LPPEIGHLKNLKTLELGTLITEYFGELMGKPLTKLPPEIGQLQNLEMLYLQDNQLTVLPPEIGQLQNLKKSI
jgi:leucine-rich repeat protein SHOC2